MSAAAQRAGMGPSFAQVRPPPSPPAANEPTPTPTKIVILTLSEAKGKDLLLALALAFPHPPHQNRHLDRSAAQWRDPRISSSPAPHPTPPKSSS